MQDPATKSVVQPAAHAARWYELLVRLSFLVALILAPCATRAQIAGTANLQGTIADPSGAVISSASVTLTDEATTVKRETHSDGSGIYIFPDIPASTYDLTVSSKGFKTFEEKGIVLEVGSSTSINPSLTVGSANVRIEVNAAGVQALQTEDPTFKQTLTGIEVDEMPLNSSNGRLVTSLLTLSPGTLSAGGGDFANGSKYNYQTTSFSVGGGMGNSTLWRLDGADNGDYMAGGNLPLPFPDAVGQTTVEMSTLGGQDGMKAGGMVQVVTKSGTNQFHGDAFEFIRNDIVDANSFYADTHDRLHQNEYGGVIGGPVWIPKVYNGKNKLFFFAGFQRVTYDDIASTATATVPTTAELAGDFRVENGDPINGVNPNPLCSTKTVSSGILQMVDPTTGALVETSPTGNGNEYPSQPVWNAASKALLPYLPPVVAIPSGLNVCGGIQYAPPAEHFDKEFITREDYNIGSRDNLYGRYFIDSYQLPAFFSPTNILLTSVAGNPEERVQTETIGENHQFSSNLVNSAHIAVMHRFHTRAYNASDIDACSSTGLNITTMTCAVPTGLQLSTGGNGIGGFTVGNSTNSVAHFNVNTGVIDDDLTWIKGRHLWVFGGEFVKSQLNISNAFNGNGVFSFNSNYSSFGPYGSKTQTADNPNAGVSAVGNGQLDFLEGAVNSFQQSKQEQNALRSTIPAIYVQDTFHLSKRLTFVAGIRWDPNYQPTDVFNRGENFSYAAFIANQHSTTYPNAPAGVSFYGDPGVPRGFTQNSPNQWDPNFGFTYDPVGDGKTIIRGGAEYMYDTANTFTSQRNQQNPPFATNIGQSLNTYVLITNPWSAPSVTGGPGAATTASILSNPFPTGASFVGRPSPSTALFPNGGQYIVLPTKFHIAAYAQWNASIQHDFPHGWQVQLQYIGSKGAHEEYGLPLNPTVWIPGTSNGSSTSCPVTIAVNGTTYNTSLGAEGGSAIPASGANCSISGNESPQRDMLTLLSASLGFPAQGALIAGTSAGTPSFLIDDTAYSTYEAGIFSVNHRLSNSFSLFGNYTWSKCLDVEDNQGDVSGTTGENPENPRVDYGPCGWDIRQYANVSIVATSNVHLGNQLASYLINHWEFGGLSTIHSGGPQTVTAGIDESLTGFGNDRAVLVPGVPIYQKVQFRSAGGAANREYLNPAAFAQPAVTPNTSTMPIFGYNTSGYVLTSKGEFHGPSYVSFDGQISRYWQLHEGVSLDTRIEAFDLLNHPNFNCCSSTTQTSGTFGQVSSTGYGPRQFQGSLKFIF
jgi:hypothetical protein